MRLITGRRLLAGAALGCAALACNLPFIGGGDEPAPTEVVVGEQPTSAEQPAVSGDSGGGAAARNYPMVGDAYDVAGIEGLLTYSTREEFSAVVQYYKDQMPLAGWTLTEEFTLGPLALLTFSGADSAVQVTVTLEASTQVVSVTILEVEP
ncbi:MAG TPA: hypothetical protein VIH26_02890 [Anaerolineales bacterium]